MHNVWVRQADRMLAPMTHSDTSLLARERAVRYLGHQFPERLRLEQALLNEIRPCLGFELRHRLWMQVGRVMRAYKYLDHLTRHRSGARELRLAIRQLLVALRVWYVEIGLAARDIHQGDLSPEATRLLDLLETKAGPGFLCAARS